MTLDSVQGQPKAVESLRAALRNGAIHHAYLFAGPEGVGKELTALAFTQALFCETAPGEGCGQCSACGRVARGNHPDLSWLVSEDGQIQRKLAARSDFTHTPSGQIRVEQIRKLQERLSFRPLEASRRVVLVVDAHLMNEAAQNAFLKTLEEPPVGTVIILIAANADTLLPTILSRCSRTHFGPLPQALIAGRLEKERKLEPGLARLVSTLAGGSLSRALAFDVDALAERAELFQRYEAVTLESAASLLSFAELYGSSREDATAALELVLVWLRDLALVKAGNDDAANADLLPALKEAAEKRTDVELHRRRQLISKTLEVMDENNAGARLQLERLLIDTASGAQP